MPQVSVIIPTFNRANFLTQSIRSALDQSYLDLEVIVVDDGSTDETAEVVEVIHDSRLLYIYQHNQGKGAAINRGVAASSGQYIGKLDSDDWYLPNVLAGLVQYLDGNPILGVVAGGYQIVDQQGGRIQDVHPWNSRPDLNLAIWIQGCPVLWQGALIRREWFEKVGGVSPNIFGPDDWDFGIRLALAGCPMRWQRMKIFNYRIHEGMSTRNVSRINQENVDILDKYFSMPEVKSQVGKIKRETYYRIYLNCAGRGYAAGLFTEGQKYLSLAIQLNPEILEDGGKGLFFNIAWWAQSPLITREPEKFVRSVVVNLPDEARQFKGNYHKALAEMYAVQFYQERERGEWERVRNLWWKIVKNDPIRLSDRGVMAVGFEALIKSGIGGKN